MAVVPKGFLSLTPTIVLDDAPTAIILYKKVGAGLDKHNELGCVYGNKAL